MVQRARKAAASFYRGDAGRQKAEEELTKQKERAAARKEQQDAPFRFRVKVGESTQFVVLDDAPDFYRFEHSLQDPKTKFWNIFSGCVKETDNCPVCDTLNRESYYALYLSVLDFTEFETRDGETHEFSRKLLVIKPAQQKKFIRAYDKAEKEGRTLRGALFEATRDGEKDSAIGNDIEFVEFLEEDELATYVRTWVDKDKKKHTEDCSVPYDYEEIFEEPDVEQLRAMVGAPPPPGSRAHERAALGGRGGRTERPARGRGADDGDDADADEGRGSSRPAARGRGRDRDDAQYERPERTERMRGRTSRDRDADDPDDDPDAADADDAGDSRNARRAARGAAPSTPARGSRRPAAEEPDDPPQRGRTAARRPRDEPDADDPPPGAGRRLPMRNRR